MGKLLKNFSLNTINQLIILIIPFITTPYLTRKLGADALGLSTYVLSLATLFYSIGTLGTNIYSRREIAYTVAKKKNIKKSFHELFLVRLILTVLTVGVYLVFMLYQDNKVIYVIFILTLLGNMLDVSWLFIGMEDMKKLVLRNCIIRIISMISVFVFIKNPSDLYLYSLIKASGDFLAFIIMLPYVAKVLKPYSKEKLEIKKHLIPIVKLFLPQAASIIYVQCDKIMLGNLTSEISSVTIYEKAEALIKLPVTFVNALSAVTLPRVANMYAGDQTSNLYPLMKKISNLTLLFIIPILIGIGLVADVFVPLYLGEEYQFASVTMIALIPAVIAISLSSITGIQFLMPLNETKTLTISYSTAAIINIILNFLLIKPYGIIGAAIATDIAEILVFVIQYIYICKKYKSFNLTDNLLKRIIALSLMIFGVILIKYFFDKSILSGLFQILVGALLFAIVIIATKDKAAMYIVNIIKSKLSNKKC